MKKKVLIVDDEVNTLVSLEYAMQQAGYLVEVASSSDEALAKLDHDAPDLLLLDVMLPGASGFGVLQYVRRNPSWQSMAIIMLTAKGRDVEVSKGLALGANAYVTKPYSTLDLLAEVRRCLSGE